MKNTLTLALILVFALSLTGGCKKDKGNPPALPPEGSMTIDFSNFENGKKSADILLPKGVEDSNWAFSALIASYFSSLITGTLIVPVTAFKLTADQTPTYIATKTWQWSFNASVLTVTYKARLTGQIRSTDVLWNMYISREGTGAFNEFLWFEGTSKLDGTGGQWILYHSHTFQEPVLQIDWTKTGTSVATIKYTYVRSLDDLRVTDPFKNSYIEYGKTTGTLDAYYNIYYYNGAEFSIMNVKWSTTGHNGNVTCVDFFGDSVPHCWDGNYVNVTCTK
jgi:hypothetical protein